MRRAGCMWRYMEPHWKLKARSYTKEAEGCPLVGSGAGGFSVEGNVSFILARMLDLLLSQQLWHCSANLAPTSSPQASLVITSSVFENYVHRFHLRMMQHTAKFLHMATSFACATTSPHLMAGLLWLCQRNSAFGEISTLRLQNP